MRFNEVIEVRKVTNPCGGRCNFTTGRKNNLWEHVTEQHSWRGRGRGGFQQKIGSKMEQDTRAEEETAAAITETT